MIRWILTVLILAAAGCASVVPPHTTHPMSDLRAGKACSSDSGGGSLLSPGHSVVVCAVKGAPHTLNDDGVSPLVKVHVLDWGWQLSDTGNWQLTVTDPAGTQILQKVLRHQVPDVGACISTGCLKSSIDVVSVPAAWKPGLYQFDLVCAFDTRVAHSLSVTLLDEK